MGVERLVAVMSALRFAFGLANLTGAFFMLRAGRVEAAVRVNGVLGSVGPFVFLLVSALGLWGLAGRISPLRLALVVSGVTLMFVGTR